MPDLIHALVGNGRALLALSATGELQRCFWPSVDGPQHVGRWWLGVRIDAGPVRWLHDSSWQHHQSYLPDTNVLETTAADTAVGLTFRVRDAALPLPGDAGPSSARVSAAAQVDVLVRELGVENAGSRPRDVQVLAYLALDVDESARYNTAYFDPDADAIAFYRQGRWFVLRADSPVADFTCEREDRALRAVSGLSAGAARLGGRAIDHGDVDAAVAWETVTVPAGGAGSLRVAFVMGSERAATFAAAAAWAGREGARGTSDSAAGGDPAAAVADRWRRWLNESAAREPAFDPLYRRSLLLLPLVANATTGGIIAAPEFDPDYRDCGGYAYCWGRDGAYVAAAMDAAGLHRDAERFFRWALTAQEPAGHWVQRHYTSGAWAPSWGLVQLDETGAILFGLGQHVERTGNRDLARAAMPAVERAVNFLLSHTDPATGLPGPSIDLWEEREGVFAYSVAAAFGGLRSAAHLAELVGEHDVAQRWHEAADLVRTRALEAFWSPALGRFVRGRRAEVPSEYRDALETPTEFVTRRAPKGYGRVVADVDSTVDCSLLGLAHPYGLVDARDPRMAATIDAVEACLTAPGGGLRRYAGDRYRGGNPWVLSTLWLGLVRAEQGDRDAAHRALEWARRHQTSLGYLPEQVDAETGRPAWVVPLTWSHAMYILLARRQREM